MSCLLIVSRSCPQPIVLDCLMKMHSSIASLWLSLTALSLHAHTNPDTPVPYSRWGAGIYYGVAQADNRALTSLLPAGMPPFTNEFRALGIEFLYAMREFSIGLELRGFISQDVSFDSTVVSVGSVAYLGQYSHVAIHNSTISVMPGLGFGTGRTTLHLPRSASPIPDDAREAQGERIGLCVRNYLLDFYLRTEIHVFQSADMYSKRNALDLVVKLGYLHGFGSENWSYLGEHLDTAPAYTLSGFYLKLGLAFLEINSGV